MMKLAAALDLDRQHTICSIFSVRWPWITIPTYFCVCAREITLKQTKPSCSKPQTTVQQAIVSTVVIAT